MTQATHKQIVLRYYKDLLLLIKRLPADKRQESLQEARSKLKQHAGEANQAKQLDLLKEMAAKISFLRVITPRSPGERANSATGHWVVRDGKLVEGQGSTAGQRVADGTMGMDEARQRHNQLLKRQFYGREPPRYNPSSF